MTLHTILTVWSCQEGASKGLDADRHVFEFAGWELPKLAGSDDLEFLEGELEDAEDVADLLAELVPYRSSFTDAEYKAFINSLVDIVTDLEEVDDEEDEDFE